MKCHTVLYARKSSEEDDRQTLSLDAQAKECQEFARRHDLVIDQVIREAHSARKPGRPLFERMLRQIEELRARSVAVRLLCHKPDRLLRNIGDWAKVDQLMDSGVEIQFVTGSFPNNAQGKMAFGMNVVFAKYYVDNLSEEVRKGLREKIARGEWPGPAPLGYRNLDRRIVPDLPTAALVRKAFEYYATGEHSLESLAEQLYLEGLQGRRRGRPLAKSVLRQRILGNPFYCGLMRYRGELHPGSHPPLVTRELFRRVQAILHGRGRPRRIRHAFRYAGLMRCARCGSAVVGEIKKQRYIYYRCGHRRGPCPERYLRQELLEAALLEAVAERTALRPQVVQALREAAALVDAQHTSTRPDTRRALEERAATIDRKLEALLDLRLAGTVDDETYAAKREQLVTDSAAVRDRLASFELPQENAREAVGWFVSTCNSLVALVRQADDAAARELLRILGSNYRLGGGKVDFEPVEPFKTAAKGPNRSLWCGEAFDVRTLLPAIAETRQRLRELSRGNAQTS